MEEKDVRNLVREGYTRISKMKDAGGCCTPSCCGGSDADSLARAIGYSEEDLAGLPDGANLGLSCGNPTAIASLSPGEVVVDLGCGAGFDVFIAARKVGSKGLVIGVDMTPEMLDRARANARKADVANADFRLGEIENLPVADASVDVVISNCVINLSPDKPQVFKEIARVLKPGGRVAVSDVVLLRPLPAGILEDVRAYVGCVSGAVTIDEYVGHVRAAGLSDVVVETRGGVDAMDMDVQDPLYKKMMEKLPPGEKLTHFVASVDVRARKERG
jgi:arsenite methyltransferase